MSLYISGIPSDRINEVWEDCEPYIEMGNGKSRDEMSVMDIYARLSEARMQLWLVFDDDKEIISVLTTEIIEYPRKTTYFRWTRLRLMGRTVIRNLRGMGIRKWLRSNGNYMQKRFYKKIREIWV